MVVAQLPIELSVAHVYRIDPTGPSGEEAIRESPGGGTYVEGNDSFCLDLELFEGLLQLRPAATDIRVGFTL